ncbi:AAA-like domain-containing protein [Nostoc sp. PA-18-2419]|uniref:AAA-like domain-containing protein n=1 Tax=Nostoc sp. PA-18-2419 TaxID=2575443 RepID=UPI001678658A
METTPTAAGIYNHHLQRHWVILQEQPELASALNNSISAADPVYLALIPAYKLNSIGLIKIHDNKATPSCQLYR